MTELFGFHGVSVDFGEARVLHGIDLSIPDDGISVLVGPSGSGKSTLLRLCNRLEVPSRGRVELRGVDLAALDPLALRRRVGMVFQRPTLFPGTVHQNLLVARADATEQRCVEALGSAALGPEFLDRIGDDLSGGEAQRACLARTLITDPEVLLLDEPTSALDQAATTELEALGLSLAAAGMPLLWVTHDLAQAVRVGTRRFGLSRGRVEQVGNGSTEPHDARG